METVDNTSTATQQHYSSIRVILLVSLVSQREKELKRKRQGEPPPTQTSLFSPVKAAQTEIAPALLYAQCHRAVLFHRV